METCRKLQVIWVGLKDDGYPWVSPSVVTVSPGDEVQFISKYDFEVEFFGRLPEDPDNRIIRCKRISSDETIRVKVSEGYRYAQSLYTGYDDFFKKTQCGTKLPDEIAEKVRADFHDPSLTEEEILHIIRKAPIEKDKTIFIFFNVIINGKAIDPGMGIEPTHHAN